MKQRSSLILSLVAVTQIALAEEEREEIATADNMCNNPKTPFISAEDGWEKELIPNDECCFLTRKRAEDVSYSVHKGYL